MGKDVPKESPQYCQMFPTGHRVFPRGLNVCNKCSKGFLRVFNAVFNNIYGALEVLNKVPKMIEVPNVIPTSHKVFPR